MAKVSKGIKASAQRAMIFRPEGGQMPLLPWSVRSVGWIHQDGPWRERNPPRQFLQLFWVESGRGSLYGCGPAQTVDLGPGMVGWYLPGEAHDLRCDGIWKYRWLTIDRGNAPEFLTNCGFDQQTRCLRPECPPPATLFERLAVDVADPRGARRAFATAVNILTQAIEPPAPDDDPVVSACLQLIEDHFSDPNCDVLFLAHSLRVHRATLHRRCLRQWGMGPGPRLQARRLAAVLQALAGSREAIARIAYDCGFSDPAYCARVVRRATGLPPRDLRGLAHN